MSSSLLPFNTETEYIFVWSEKTGEEPEPYQKHSFSGMRIHTIASQPNTDDTYPCTADFKLNDLTAIFTCTYHPSLDTFSNFQFIKDTAKGGMEAVTSVTISFHRELDGEEISVRDEHGNLFIFVQLEFGYEDSFPISGDIWGKKAMRGERNWWKLTGKERWDLELDRWDDEQRDEHFALVAQRRKEEKEEKEVELGWQGEQAGRDEGVWGGMGDGQGEGGLGWLDSTMQDDKVEW